MFSGRLEKQDGRPGLWLAKTNSTSSLKRFNGIQRNLTGSEILTSSTMFVFFGPRSEKQDGGPGLWLAETFSTSPLKRLNRIQRNLTGSKISTSCTKFVFFWPIGKTRWPPWRWTEFKETWPEARSKHLLPSLCFSGRWVNKNCCPGQSVKKVAHCTQVHDVWPCGPLVYCSDILLSLNVLIFTLKNKEML